MRHSAFFLLPITINFQEGGPDMNIQLREWKITDTKELALQANNRNIAQYLRDTFPFPYAEDDAREFIRFCKGFTGKDLFFAITVDGKIAGGANIGFREDVNVKTAGIGYWLGEAFHGQGIGTWAVGKLCEIAFGDYDILRLDAELIADNYASRRVLEKNGFTCEGILRQYVLKYGKVLDAAIYAILRDERQIG